MVETKASSQDIEKAFKEYSVAEFFKKNRQMLGYSGEVRSLTTIVHEYVSNSLDSCEDARILPEITVQIEALAATTRSTELGTGDGTTTSFDVPDEIAKAAVLNILVDGLNKERGTDYVIKYVKKGKQSVRQLVFKNEAPAKDAKITAKWTAGHLKVAVEDNGTGIPKTKVGLALGKLLAGTKFQTRAQKRGQQGIGACMRSDTLVPFADGRILAIKEIVDKNMVGEEILSLDLASQKLLPAKIKQCVKVTNPFFFEVKTSRGRLIYLTPENPVLTVRNNTLEWVRSDSIKEGEKIAAPAVSENGKIKWTEESDIENHCQTKSALMILKTRNKFHSQSDIEWLTVNSVKKVRNKEEFVYDLEIEQHHNFVANGLVVHNSYATLFSQITTGKPTHVKTSTGDYKVFECDVAIDIKTNEPVVSNQKEYSGKYQGVKIEVEFAEVSYDRSEYGVYEYLRRTALANPHAQITLIEPSKEIMVFPRATNQIPKKPDAVKPHPLGLTTSDVMDMAQVTQARKLSSFFTSDFSKVSTDKISELKALLPGIDFEKHPKNMVWQEAEAIVNAFKKIKFYNPDTDTLQPISEQQLEKSLKNLLSPEKLKVVERKPKVFRGGIPFLVEAAIAYGGKAGGVEGETQGEVMRFANRVPLLFDAGTCAITEAAKTIEWARYDLKDFEKMPVSIFVNFVSVYVPYTGAGKLAISSEEEIVAEIRMALMECAREISVYLHGLKHAQEQEQRRQIFVKYIKEVAQALNELTGVAKTALEAKLQELAKEKTALLEAREENGEAALEAIEATEEEEIQREN